MILLGIETSCDETSVGIVEKKASTLSVHVNSIATSLALHSNTGGIIPEIAAREQVKYMIPCLADALKVIPSTSIDAIAVTYGPGLVGSLLVGIETAKTLSMLWNKPLIPVNHMVGHIYANWITTATIQFPSLVLVVSGGHTDLVLLHNHHSREVIGRTRDDAAGEAFDKIARLLDLPYPGGPSIQEKARKGNPDAIRFPRPLIGDKSFDFSFSGLKTAVLRETLSKNEKSQQWISDMAASAQEAIIDVLTRKTMRAAEAHSVQSVLLSGGVGANEALRLRLSSLCAASGITFHAPTKEYCTDNGAMIAAAAAFNYHPLPWDKVTVDPELYYSLV